MNKRQITAVALCVLLGLGGYLIYSYNVSDDGHGKIKIAVNIPLTGPIAAFSSEYKNGLRLGIDDACKELGLDKNMFELMIGDNTGKASIATTIAEKHCSTGFDVYISGTSDESKAIFPQIDEFSVPHLLMTFDAFQTTDGKNRLRIFPHFKLMAPLFTQYALDRNAKQVYSITLNGLATEELFGKLIEPVLDENGIKHSRETFDSEITDYRTITQKAIATQPDLIFLSGFSIHLLPLIRSLKENGYTNGGNVFCVMDFVDLLKLPNAASEFDGIAFIAPEFEVDTSGLRKNWTTSYKNSFKVVPNYVPAYAYDLGYLIVLAQKNATTVTKSSIMQQLPFDGIVGRLTVDEAGDLNSSLLCVEIDETGKVITSRFGNRLSEAATTGSLGE